MDTLIPSFYSFSFVWVSFYSGSSLFFFFLFLYSSFDSFVLRLCLFVCKLGQRHSCGLYHSRCPPSVSLQLWAMPTVELPPAVYRLPYSRLAPLFNSFLGLFLPSLLSKAISYLRRIRGLGNKKNAISLAHVCSRLCLLAISCTPSLACGCDLYLVVCFSFTNLFWGCWNLFHYTL